jgi:acyl carrier protein
MPTYQETLTQLYEVLKPYAKEGQVLTETTELVADLGLDSMKVMQLVLEAEERFDISIPLNILPDVRTVRDFAAQVEQLTGQRQ